MFSLIFTVYHYLIIISPTKNYVNDSNNPGDKDFETDFKLHKE